MVVLSFAALVVSSPLIAQNVADPALAIQLRAEDQRLLESVHNGNREEWDKATAEDFVYIEEGSIIPRAEFVKELEADGAPTLRIRAYELHRFGDTALVLHHDDIPALPGESVRTGGEYLMSETWQLLNGVWKLHIVHIDAVRINPPALTLTVPQMDEVVGTYRNGDALYVVHREGNRLIGSRSGRPDTELLAETRDVFFVAGDTRRRRIFQRDVNGTVTGFVTRDENADRLWVRTVRLR